MPRPAGVPSLPSTTTLFHLARSAQAGPEITIVEHLVESRDQAGEAIATGAGQPSAETPAQFPGPAHGELVEKIIDTIVTEGMIDREKVTPDATIESLDLKSIDIVMILTAIEDKFDVYIPMDGPFHDAKNVQQLIEAIANYITKEKQQA